MHPITYAQPHPQRRRRGPRRAPGLATRHRHHRCRRLGDGNSAAGTAAKPQREALSADVAAKVKAAALAKVPGATVLRTEAGGPYNTAYHAHIKTAGGTEQVVLVNDKFEATAVQADKGRGGGNGRGGDKGHGGHGNETPLTGDTKSKVEAAVLAKYRAPRSCAPRPTMPPPPPTSRTSRPAPAPSSRSPSARTSVVDANEHPAHP